MARPSTCSNRRRRAHAGRCRHADARVMSTRRWSHRRASTPIARVMDARNRHEPGVHHRPKVCAVLQIRTQKAFADVKSFCPCFVPVREAVAMPPAQATVAGCSAGASAVQFAKVLLLSVFLSTHRRSDRCVHADNGRRRGVAERLRRVQARCAGGRPCEIFSQGLLTVKKSVIRFRPADLACQTSEPNRHPVAKHNQNIRRASQDGGVGFATSGEMQGHPAFDTCLASCGRYLRIRHDALDATAVPARQ